MWHCTSRIVNTITTTHPTGVVMVQPQPPLAPTWVVVVVVVAEVVVVEVVAMVACCLYVK